MVHELSSTYDGETKKDYQARTGASTSRLDFATRPESHQYAASLRDQQNKELAEKQAPEKLVLDEKRERLLGGSDPYSSDRIRHELEAKIITERLEREERARAERANRERDKGKAAVASGIWSYEGKLREQVRQNLLERYRQGYYICNSQEEFDKAVEEQVKSMMEMATDYANYSVERKYRQDLYRRNN
jgi:regulator of replication initiation timing